MAEEARIGKPRIFISHAWEDKALVRRLEADLETVGAKVWVDHTGVRGGDNLPKRISDALEWCDTLLLVWSEAARNSDWVVLEWSNAISLKRTVIPCLLDLTPLPGILTNRAYIDFREIDRGISRLLHALNLAQQPLMPTARDAAEPAAHVIYKQLIEKTRPVKPRPPQLSLRSQRLDNLSIDDVKKMLKEKDFCDKSWNEKGKGLLHHYELIERREERLVIDYATGLAWQQSGSSSNLTYIYAEAYIRELNNHDFAGADWRLPTIEEAMSLMEPQKHGELYLDPVFDRLQRRIWTADRDNTGWTWMVSFYHGLANIEFADDSCLNYVRAVLNE
jgi:hypothetical protein